MPWDDSRALPTFTFRRLDPWAGDWRRVLRAEHLDAGERLQELLQDLLLRKKGRPRFPTRDELLLWGAVVAEVTAGHPGLVDGAFDLFVALVFNGLVRDGRLDAEEARKHALRKRCR